MPDPYKYTVGLICAFETEYVAAQAFLDQEHGRPDVLSPGDNNDYTLGEIEGHRVVIAVLPDGEYGTSSAACVARDMLHSFPNIRFGLMVGVGGGAPSPKHDIRLGDIVVSSSRGGYGGVLQYDLGKEVQGQVFHQTGFLNQPPTILRTALNGLKAQYERKGHQLEEAISMVLRRNTRMRRKYKRPASESDRLYASQFVHPQNSEKSCAELCGTSELIVRPERTEEEDNPVIHYGLIASGNKLIKDALLRDQLAAERNILCFEMEAAGLMNHFPSLVIRGICDYADSHKNKEWQGYAAMSAAAYAKDLLCRIVPEQVKAERKASEILGDIQDRLNNVHSLTNTAVRNTDHIDQKLDLAKLPVAEGAEFDSYINQHESECFPGTRTELCRQIAEWAVSPQGKCIFWLNGMAGTGKSTISRTIAKSFQENKLLGASFFFKRGEADRRNATRFFPTITRQLGIKIPSLVPGIRKAIEEDPGVSSKSLREQFDKLILQPLLSLKESDHQSSTMVIVIDALDECENENDIRVILQLLPRIQKSSSVPLRIFVTSRPELPIRLGFKDVGDDHQDLVLHEISKPVIEYDLSLFLQHRIAQIKKDRSLPPDWPGDVNLQTLVTMSVPLFIFAATMCRVFEDHRLDPVQSLADILKYQSEESKLDGTYLPVLNRIIANYSQKRKKQLAEEFEEVVGVIILLESPLSVISLSKLIGASTISIKTRLNSLHSVLDIPDDETLPIRLFHLSFRDFLLDPETGGKTLFWVDKQKMHQRITIQCLELMRHTLKKNICNFPSYGTERTGIDTRSIYQNLPPELQYSCRYWAFHLAQSKDPLIELADAFAFLQEHFLHWVEAMSILGFVSEVVGTINSLQSIIKDMHDSKIFEFLHDAKRFVLKNIQIADIAPLQLYCSGLTFAPRMTIIRKSFEHLLPGWLHRLPIVEETWSPEADPEC